MNNINNCKNVVEKDRRKLIVLIAMMIILFFVTCGITYAYFTSTAKVNGITFRFAKLETAISIDGGSTFSNGIGLTLEELFNGANVTNATVIANNIAVKINASDITGYLRVKAPYSGTDEESQNLSIVLNSQFFSKATFENSAYKWQNYNGFYYLVNANNDKLYKCSSNDVNNVNGGYKLFDSGLYFPDLTKYEIFGVENGEVITKVHFELKAESVQCANIDAENVSELHKIINDNQIFNDYINLGYIIEYETFGGDLVKGQIVSGSDITFPKVGEENGVNVAWYSEFSNGVYGNFVGNSGDVLKNAQISKNLKLFAKYPSSSVFYVYFDSNGATTFEGLSSPQTVEYAESGNASFTFTNIEKLGYNLSGFAVKGNNAIKIDFDKENKKISIARNVQKAGKALTIIPIWENVDYTAVFVVNGGEISSAEISKLGLSGNSSNGFTKTYTNSSNLCFPIAVKADSVLIGWQVSSETNGLADIKWRSGDLYRSGEIASGYFGNVTFTAIYGILKFKENTITKYLGESNFTNLLTNTTNSPCTFYSSNSSVAMVDESSGEVSLKDVGVTTVTAKNAFGSVSYTLNVLQIIVQKPSITGSSVFTYDGNEKSIGLSNPSANYTISGVQSATNAGNYTLTIALMNKTTMKWNDNTTDDIVITWTINKGTISATITGIETNYDGANKYATAKVTTPTSATINYGENASSYSYTLQLSTASKNLSNITLKDVGTKTIYYKISASNYNDKEGSVTIKINKATFTPTLNFSNYTYGSAPSYSVSNNKSGGSVTYKYATSSSGTYSGFTASATALMPNTYYIKAVIASTSNYNSTESSYVKVTVSKQAGYINLSTNKFYMYRMTYKQTKDVNITSSHGDNYSYSIKRNDSIITSVYSVSIVNNVITIIQDLKSYDDLAAGDKITVTIVCKETDYYASASAIITIEILAQTCFVAGTKITMADGSYKNIEDIVSGDKVLSYDEISGEIVASEVEYRTINTYTKNMAILTLVMALR